MVMSIVQNALAKSSSSFIMSKVLGYISDILTLLMGSTETIIAFIIRDVLRDIPLLVGIIVAVALGSFINYTLHHPLLIFYVLNIFQVTWQAWY